jgi:hypothetical protein
MERFQAKPIRFSWRDVVKQMKSLQNNEQITAESGISTIVFACDSIAADSVRRAHSSIVPFASNMPLLQPLNTKLFSAELQFENLRPIARSTPRTTESIANFFLSTLSRGQPILTPELARLCGCGLQQLQTLDDLKPFYFVRVAPVLRQLLAKTLANYKDGIKLMFANVCGNSEDHVHAAQQFVRFAFFSFRC